MSKTAKQIISMLKDEIRKAVISFLLKRVERILCTKKANELMLHFAIIKYLETKITPTNENDIDIQEQVQVISQVFYIDPKRFFEKTRKREIVEARQFFFWYKIVKEGYGPNIAFNFGFDHATAIHAKKTVNNLIDTNKAYLEKFDKAIKKLDKLNSKAA